MLSDLLDESSDKTGMKVSIIIPVYNAEKYLRECLESALNQDYGNTEIIAVNDGSKDDSLKILEEYSDRIQIISKPNGGTASALNAGIQAMQGEWFKWLSADDLLYPYAVQELVNSTKKLENKENCIIYSNYDIIDSQGKILRQWIEPNHNSMDSFEFNTILLDHYIGNGITSLIHKSAFDRFGMFDENVIFLEDVELWLRLCILHKFRLHLVPKILAKYRVHQNQLTKTNGMWESIDNENKIRTRILNQLDKEKQRDYRIALKKYKRAKPIMVRVRSGIRDVMFKTLPKSTTETIIKKYRKKRKKN